MKILDFFSPSTKNSIHTHIGVAFRTKGAFPLHEQIDFCKKAGVSHIQLQARYDTPFSEKDNKLLRDFLKEDNSRTLASHLTSPEYDSTGKWLNSKIIMEEIEEVAHLSIKKVTIHPGKFDGADETMKHKVFPHLLRIVQLGKTAGVVMCFENLPYKMWKDQWKQKFGVTPEDFLWLRSQIIATDPTLDPFCKFTLDTGHIAGSNRPFRIHPETFASQLGWEHIYIIHANDVQQLKKIYGFRTDVSLKEIFKKRMESKSDNKKLKQVKKMIEEDPYLAKIYNDLIMGLDHVMRAHVPLHKGTIQWSSFWRAYLKCAPHCPTIYLELGSIEDMHASLAAVRRIR